MDTKIKTYKIRDFIRFDQTGQIDFDRSKKLIGKIAATAAFHADRNILIDLRETAVTTNNMNDLLQLALEMTRYKPFLGNKIANLVPNNNERLSIAKKFKACLVIKGFEYDFFTDFESAIEWLSETSELN